MRVRTKERRDTIVAAAWEAFKENGFERTTMSEITARVGGSKATIYGYFKSKDELFAAALDHAFKAASEEVFKPLTQTGALATRLQRFARSHIEMVLSPEMIAVDRILVAEAERANIYEVIRQKSVMKRQQIADVLKLEIEQGRLRRTEPVRAAMHLLALIECDVRDRCLRGDKTVTKQMVQDQIREGVKAFLRAYAPA